MPRDAPRIITLNKPLKGLIKPLRGLTRGLKGPYKALKGLIRPLGPLYGLFWGGQWGRAGAPLGQCLKYLGPLLAVVIVII